jgi:hypothetical protein
MSEQLDRIEDGVARIRWRLRLNTFIFGITGLVGLLTAGVAIGLIFQGRTLSQQSQRNYLLAESSLRESAKANARLEASDSLYMNYIKTTVGQILDKLQKDNPQINVPKAPELRPPGLPLVNESDLERPKSERPKFTPTPLPKAAWKAKPSLRGKKSRGTPTPKPWFNFFKNTR